MSFEAKLGSTGNAAVVQRREQKLFSQAVKCITG
jgi:hypothetical protein